MVVATTNFLEVLKKELLPKVNKPAQYLGNEHGALACLKDWDAAKCRMALIYPDLYELGSSSFGIKLLYNIVNQHPDYICDRAFAPMPDMEALLEERGLALWGLETYKALGDFDLLGFSLAYELCYTNILTILKLSKIPFKSKDRDLTHPFIFGGGPATHNPEVMADYFDFYLIGDGEDLIIEIQDLLARYQEAIEQSKRSSTASVELREQILFELAQIKGVYVPSLYRPDPENNYLPKPIRDGIPERVVKRVADLNDFNQAIGPVPHLSTVHDKQVMEIRRGCDRGCRFCQVGYTYLPVRERSPEDLARLSQIALDNTGYEDYSLLSLSASDYTCLTDAARAMNNMHADKGISLSMPSQRADRFNVDLASEIQQVRKSGVTLAPEAGTERLRRVINKGLRTEEIERSIRNVFLKGWVQIKLYFMIGLPFETDEDLDGILDLLSWSINMAREIRNADRQQYKKQLNITCTISTFVPKSFTAFQWFSQCSRSEFQRKEKYLLQGLKERGLTRFVKLNCTEPELAVIESVLSRANREWGQVIEEVWQQGSRLDSWSENFNIERWSNAATKFGLDLDEEATRVRVPGSKQAWDVLDLGFTDDFFLKEWGEAVAEIETSPCTENKCHACGVCFNLGVKNLVTIDQSDKNPFVTEIDKEARKKSCAAMSESWESLLKPKEYALAEDTSQPTIIVKHHQTVQKLRLVLSKTGDLRFTGHLDFQKLIERAIRRAKLPIVHTIGYNQRMKLSWGPALPLFIESEWEYLEIGLAESVDDSDNFRTFRDILGKELPKEVTIKKVESILPDDKSSINKVLETQYKANLVTTETNCLAEIQQSDVEQFLSQEIIELEKQVKGKHKKRDIRPFVLDIQRIGSTTLELKLKETQRVEDVLQAFQPGSMWQVTKTYQKIA